MSQKPPAFQFYAKDWRSSHNVKKMTRQERGDYIDLLAAAWESEEPGTLPAPVELAARCAGLDVRLVRNFFNKYPHIFALADTQQGPKYINEKLHKMYLNYREISEVRADVGKRGGLAKARNLLQQKPSSAFASASATAIKEYKPARSNGNGDGREVERYINMPPTKIEPEEYKGTLTPLSSFTEKKYGRKI